MFSLSVVDTDAFLEMPLSSRLLYYELGMRADDDGFVNDWKKIIRFTGLAEDDLKVLIAKKFIIPFDSGVIVIRHWRLNNYLQRDRTTATNYQKEISQLNLVNGVYEPKNPENSDVELPVYNMDTARIQPVYTDKIRLDKIRLDKNRLNNNSGTKKFVPPTLAEVQEYVNTKQLKNVDAKQFFEYFTEGNWVDAKGQKVKNWKQKILTWEKYNQHPNQRPQKVTSNPFVEVLLEQEDPND